MQINHLTYYGGTQEKAIKFYGEVLGLETKLVDGKVWVKISDEYLIHLSSDESATTGGKCHFGFVIDNVYDFAEKVSEKTQIFDLIDGKEVGIPEIKINIKQFFVKDPAGNLIEILKY